MLTNFGDIKNDVIVKMGITTTSAYYTDDILNDWIRQAERWATSYRKWPFSEGKVETTYTGVEEWNFEGIKADSIRLLQIGGLKYEKQLFEDYQIYKEKEPQGAERIFTDFARTTFINTLAGGSGTLTAWMQYTPAPIDVTDPAAETIFSNGDEEGNEAIVEEVLYYADIREEKEDVSNFHHTRATQILDGVFENYLDEQFNYKTNSATGGMYKRIDVVNGGTRDDIFNRNQF